MTFDRLAAFCETTNHSDKHILREAVRMERRHMGNIKDARRMVFDQWCNGYNHPDTPISEIAGIRDGALHALLLGAGHARRASQSARYKTECDAMVLGGNA